MGPAFVTEFETPVIKNEWTCFYLDHISYFVRQRCYVRSGRGPRVTPPRMCCHCHSVTSRRIPSREVPSNNSGPNRRTRMKNVAAHRDFPLRYFDLFFLHSELPVTVVVVMVLPLRWSRRLRLLLLLSVSASIVHPRPRRTCTRRPRRGRGPTFSSTSSFWSIFQFRRKAKVLLNRGQFFVTFYTDLKKSYWDHNEIMSQKYYWSNHGFGQAKFPDGGLVLGSSQFSILPQQILKIDPKIIISLRQSKSVTHSVVIQNIICLCLLLIIPILKYANYS